MKTGTVKWFDDQKGYGFIKPDVAGKDVFVHHEELFGDAYRAGSPCRRQGDVTKPEARADGPRAFHGAVTSTHRNRRYGAVDG